MYKKAAKNKLRFNTSKGLITVEDLWDLPLSSKNGVSLDSVATALDSELKASTTSFVTKTTTKNSTLELSFEIVKDIIADRLSEKEATVARVARQQEQSHIRQLLSDKKYDDLAGKTVEELEAMLD